jgi:uncharacterized protein YhbP (UPF0306 family)
MPRERSKTPLAGTELEAASRELLDASTLCAVATVTPAGDAYINTAYFAWSPELDVVWLSDPDARHSRHLGKSGTAAVAVYDSSQTWGKPDRGIQLFGAAHPAEAAASGAAEAVYAERFPEFQVTDLSSYRFYVFRPHRVKLFDEGRFGAGLFVVAAVAGKGELAWETTEIYPSD